MDATNPSAIPTWASRTPIHIGVTALAVRDFDRMSRFYAGLLGLSEIENTGSAVRLGVNAKQLLRRPAQKLTIRR